MRSYVDTSRRMHGLTVVVDALSMANHSFAETGAADLARATKNPGADRVGLPLQNNTNIPHIPGRCLSCSLIIKADWIAANDRTIVRPARVPGWAPA